jgi:hypothetical protein
MLDMVGSLEMDFGEIGYGGVEPCDVFEIMLCVVRYLGSDVWICWFSSSARLLF